MTEEQHTTAALIVADVTILHDAYGRYNLNLLHQASETGEAKKPGNWLKRKSTQDLIAALADQVSNTTLEVVHGGGRAGTYAHELLAVSYAGWISPAFQLKVNQAFLDMKHGHPDALPAATPGEVALALAQAVITIERRQLAIEARQDVLDAKVDDLTERMPPAGKLRIEDWLRREAKPYLHTELMRLLRAACARRERPTEFRPEGLDWPLRYYTPATIAEAYSEVTRQLTLLPGGNGLIRDPGVAYRRTARRH